MKKYQKISKIITVLMVVMMLATITTNVLAATDPSTFKGDGNVQTDKLSSGINNIIKVISYAGSGIAVIVLIVLGIKYMMGSAEEKAEYKKTLLPYILGAVLVFAASTIASIIFSFANTFTV